MKNKQTKQPKQTNEWQKTNTHFRRTELLCFLMYSYSDYMDIYKQHMFVKCVGFLFTCSLYALDVQCYIM